MAAEKPAPFSRKFPSHIRGIGPDALQVNAVRQKNVIPRLGGRRFRLWLVSLDADFAALNVDLVQLPAAKQDA